MRTQSIHGTTVHPEPGCGRYHLSHSTAYKVDVIWMIGAEWPRTRSSTMAPCEEGIMRIVLNRRPERGLGGVIDPGRAGDGDDKGCRRAWGRKNRTRLYAVQGRVSHHTHRGLFVVRLCVRRSGPTPSVIHPEHTGGTGDRSCMAKTDGRDVTNEYLDIGWREQYCSYLGMLVSKDGAEIVNPLGSHDNEPPQLGCPEVRPYSGCHGELSSALPPPAIHLRSSILIGSSLAPDSIKICVMKKDWDAAEERTQDQLALMEDDDIDEWLAMDTSSETTPIASSRATSAGTSDQE
nr:1-aminocyclopropane-1-carboxylate synthase 11-like [Ipomoea trifida]